MVAPPPPPPPGGDGRRPSIQPPPKPPSESSRRSSQDYGSPNYVSLFISFLLRPFQSFQPTVASCVTFVE